MAFDFAEMTRKHKAEVAARRADPKPLIFIVNCKTPICEWPNSDWHYVGRAMRRSPIYRGSELANPFHQRDHGRKEAIELYRRWLWDQQKAGYGPVIRELMDVLEYSLARKGISLGCWCAPKLCHAEVIKRCVEWMWSEGVRPEGWTVDKIY